MNSPFNPYLTLSPEFIESFIFYDLVSPFIKNNPHILGPDDMDDQMGLYIAGGEI